MYLRDVKSRREIVSTMVEYYDGKRSYVEKLTSVPLELLDVGMIIAGPLNPSKNDDDRPRRGNYRVITRRLEPVSGKQGCNRFEETYVLERVGKISENVKGIGIPWMRRRVTLRAYSLFGWDNPKLSFCWSYIYSCN